MWNRGKQEAVLDNKRGEDLSVAGLVLGCLKGLRMQVMRRWGLGSLWRTSVKLEEHEMEQAGTFPSTTTCGQGQVLP